MIPAGVGVQRAGHGSINNLILHRRGLRSHRRLVPFRLIWRFFIPAASRSVVTGPVRGGDWPGPRALLRRNGRFTPWRAVMGEPGRPLLAPLRPLSLARHTQVIDAGP